jgi:hypothetical protein
MVKLTGKAKAKFLARMKKGRAAAKKRGGGNKKNSSRKKLLRYDLKQRLKQLEQEVEYLKSKGFTNYNPTTMQGVDESQKEIKIINDELKKELDAGRNS